jgi:hypothetical protein
MYLSVEESPNGEALEGRVFQERTPPRVVTEVLRRRGGKDVWCPIVAVEAGGVTGPALARKVDDSGEGTCYLVYGGRWGIRLKEPACQDPWNFTDPHQWGETFLLLSADGADLKFDRIT